MISMFKKSDPLPPEKSIIFITDNCGGQFRVKLYLTIEIKKLLDFMMDNGIIENWMPVEEDLYEI